MFRQNVLVKSESLKPNKIKNNKNNNKIMKKRSSYYLYSSS